MARPLKEVLHSNKDRRKMQLNLMIEHSSPSKILLFHSLHMFHIIYSRIGQWMSMWSTNSHTLLHIKHLLTTQIYLFFIVIYYTIKWKLHVVVAPSGFFFFFFYFFFTHWRLLYHMLFTSGSCKYIKIVNIVCSR